MGWSTKHGLRPNRTRPLRSAGGQIVPRREPVHVVGVMVRAVEAVRVDRNGWDRMTWCVGYKLLPTKGWRVDTPLRKVIEHDDEGTGDGPPKGWPEPGIYLTKSFHRF